MKLGYCTYCKRKLVPIGKSRSNGKYHNDWQSRTLHKKCWLLLQDFDRYENPPSKGIKAEDIEFVSDDEE